MTKNPDKNWSLLICLTLTLVTLAVYYQVHSFKFIIMDDSVYVCKNPNIQAGITFKAVKWAFTTNYAEFWHPLTWLSLMLDWQLFGSSSAGFHLTNLIIHIANTLLLFLVLKRMTNALWQSAFVAALFALHPLHIEAVAWVAERKEVLSAFFWILTMWAYLRYVKQSNIFRYFLTMLIFALGLMAKPMLVTLPFVFLLLDYWPLDRMKRFDWKIIYRLVWEKFPFFILSAIGCAVAFFAEKHGGMVASFVTLSLKYRIYNAFISYIEYIKKMIWPVKLAIIYPHPGLSVSVLYAVISAILLLVVTIFILGFAGKRKYLVTGWFWYLGTLLPVIGLIQVGTHAMADRYSYITLTGLFIIIAWGLPELIVKWSHRKFILWNSSLIVLSALAVCTYLQAQYWKDTITVFQHALAVTNYNYNAHFLMTKELLEQGRIDEAIWHNAQALQIKPDYIDALNGMGVALHEAGRVDEAVVYYKKAIEIDPHTYEANANLGFVLASKGKFAEAARHYEIAMETMDTPSVHRNYAQALFNLGRFQESVAQYHKVLLTMPGDPNVINELGYVLAHSGKFDEAITRYNEALRISPDSIDIHLNLGTALTSSGKFEEAKKEYEKILFLQPQNAVAHNDFGVVLYRLGKLDDAISHFQQAVQINPQYTDAKNNLKAVLAEKQKTQGTENIKK
jgi:Flp pilus assembly protein TadD